MGVSGPKYAGVPAGGHHGSFDNVALEVEDSVPIVPVATAVVDASSSSGLENPPSSLPTARRIGGNPNDDDDKARRGTTEEREDGITVTWEKGEAQPSAYRDKWFAVAFVAHLVVVTGSAIAKGPDAWKALTAIDQEAESNEYGEYGDDGDGDATDNFPAPPVGFWVAVVAIAMLVAPALSFLALTLMHRNAVRLIKASLWFSIALCSVVALVLLPLAFFAGIIYAVFAVCLVWYARRVQSRIPYAASNLKTGISVLKTNLGLGLVSLGTMVGLLGYCLGWAYGFAGVMTLPAMTVESTSYSQNSSESQSDLSTIGGVVVFFFVLSFYWTHQVMKNVVRATVSGVVGTWWFSPLEATSFCSAGVSDSFVRSTTYSLGSICFGSLIVAVLHMVRNSLRSAQNNRNAGVLRCIAVCILSYIERLVEYFNKWAYIYVGLYGYGYVDAGKRVISLFKTRGWQTIIADNLVNRLLGITSLAIGILTGICTLLAAFLVEEFEAKQGWMGVGFGVGFLIGVVLSGVFMGLLSSAVDAVIVCYAEAPKELEESHPEVAREMSQTWAEAWGDQLGGPVIISLGSGLGVV